MFIFGLGRRCPGISRHAPRAAGPSLRSRGGGDGAVRSLAPSGLSSCALRRRLCLCRRSSPRSAWRWRPPQEPQVGAVAGSCPSAGRRAAGKAGGGLRRGRGEERPRRRRGPGRTAPHRTAPAGGEERVSAEGLLPRLPGPAGGWGRCSGRAPSHGASS